MKKIFLIGCMTLLLAAVGFTQDEEVDTERIQQMRMAFFEEELQFSPEESKAFWPIYNQFREDQRKLKRQFRANRKLELMSDEEAEQYVEDFLQLEEKELALKRAYINKLKGVINIRKIAMINATERKFKQTLLHKIQERRGGQGFRNGIN